MNQQQWARLESCTYISSNGSIENDKHVSLAISKSRMVYVYQQHIAQPRVMYMYQ